MGLIIIFLMLALSPSQASAYIDPGTGSYFFQILLAGLLGLLFTLKLFWSRFVAFFRRIFRREEDKDGPG